MALSSIRSSFERSSPFKYEITIWINNTKNEIPTGLIGTNRQNRFFVIVGSWLSSRFFSLIGGICVMAKASDPLQLFIKFLAIERNIVYTVLTLSKFCDDIRLGVLSKQEWLHVLLEHDSIDYQSFPVSTHIWVKEASVFQSKFFGPILQKLYPN